MISVNNTIKNNLIWMQEIKNFVHSTNCEVSNVV